MDDFLTLLTANRLVFDGSMGALLTARGIDTNCPALLCVTAPDDIFTVHRDYAAAGADVIITNTFSANPIKLAKMGLSDRLAEIIRASVALARRAGKFVALNIGPTGEFLYPMGELRESELEAAFLACAEAGREADAIIIETMSDVRECACAVRAAKKTGLPVIASMTFDANARTLTGCLPECAALILVRAGADAVGINCGVGPEGMLESVQRMRRVTSLPMVVQPNAGMPELIGGRNVYPATPESFEASMRKIVKAGANAIGGCCGTTPAHIAHLRALLAEARPIAPVGCEYICSERAFIDIASVKARRVTDIDDLFELDDGINAVELNISQADDPCAFIEEAQSVCKLPFLFRRDTPADILSCYAGVPGYFI